MPSNRSTGSKDPGDTSTGEKSAGSNKGSHGRPLTMPPAYAEWVRMWRHGSVLGILLAIAFALTSTTSTQAQGVVESCGETEAHCRLSGNFSAVNNSVDATLPGITSPSSPAFGDLIYSDYIALEEKARAALTRGAKLRESMSPYRDEVGFEDFIAQMDYESGWTQAYTGTTPYAGPLTFLQNVELAEADLTMARDIYGLLAVVANESGFRADPAYSAELCAKAENPNPPDLANTGQVLDPDIDWCNFKARLRQSVREVADIHLILGQQFMVDGLGLYFGADLIGGEPFVKREIAQLRAAQHQFTLAEKFLADGLTHMIGNGCRISDFYTQHEWSLLTRASQQYGNAQYLIGSRLSYLRANSPEAVIQTKANAKAAIREGANEDYVQLIGLSSLSRINKVGCEFGEHPNGDAVAEMTLNMLDAQRNARDLESGRNIFGFDVTFTPARPYASAVPMNCDTSSEQTRGLWDTARCTAIEAQELQTRAEMKQRDFEDTQSQLRAEVDKVRETYDKHIDDVVGCTQQVLGDEEFFKCADAQLALAKECIDLTDVFVIPGSGEGDLFVACMARSTVNKSNDMDTGLKELRSVYLEYEGILLAARNMVVRIALSKDANKTVTDWIIGTGTATTLAAAAQATFDTVGCIDFANPLSTATSSASCATTGMANLLAQSAAGAISTAADVEIANAENKVETENMALDMSEMAIAAQAAYQAYASKYSDVEGMITALERDVLEAKRQRAFFASSPANDPSFRMMRDSTRLELAEALERAAKFAYLAARRAEYEYAARLSESGFAISDIYRARTAQDIRNYLTALESATTFFAGRAAFQRSAIDLLPISVAKNILFLDDQSLIDKGVHPLLVESERQRRFQVWVREHTVNAGLPSESLAFSMTTSLLSDGLFANLEPTAFDGRWLMMMAGKPPQDAGSKGLRVNLKSTEQGLSYRTVRVTQGGIMHLRSQAGCIFDYRLMEPAALLGLEWAGNQPPERARSTFNADVNGANVNSGNISAFQAGEFRGRPVSSTAWTVTISTASPGAGLPKMDLSKLTDIEFVMGVVVSSRDPGEPELSDCARIDY